MINAREGFSNTAARSGLASTGTDIYTLIGNIVSAILSLVGIVFLVMVIYGGFLWTTSQGNMEQVKKAKTLIIQAIFGLVVVMASYALTAFIIGGLTSGVTGEQPAAVPSSQSTDPNAPNFMGPIDCEAPENTGDERCSPEDTSTGATDEEIDRLIDGATPTDVDTSFCGMFPGDPSCQAVDEEDPE